MAKTFQNAQDHALTFGYGENDRTNMKQFLNMALRDIYKRRRWKWLQVVGTINTTAGVPTNNLVYDGIRRFAYFEAANTTSSPPPVFVDGLEYDRRWRDKASATGKPTIFTVYFDSATWYFKWYPVPDRVYSYNYRGYYTVPTADMSANSDPLGAMPDEGFEALVARALYYQAIRDRSPELAAYWDDVYQRELKMMVDIDKEVAGATTPLKAKLPQHYDGAYDVRGA